MGKNKNLTGKQAATKQKSLKADVLAELCPSRKILNNVTSKWSVLVFVVLAEGKIKRFSELRREIGGISEKMLTQTLKALEEDQFVIRKSYNVVPPYVEYSLTDLGKGAASRVLGLSDWIEANLTKIEVKKAKR